MKWLFIGLAIGTIFGAGFALLFKCKLDLTSVAVAAVYTAPVFFTNIINYRLGRSNRNLMRGMHEENTETLQNIQRRVNTNGVIDAKSHQA